MNASSFAPRDLRRIHRGREHPGGTVNAVMQHAAATAAPDLAAVAMSWLYWRSRLVAARRDERGMTTETVIITAGLAALAVAMIVLIGNRVRQRARDIP